MSISLSLKHRSVILRKARKYSNNFPEKTERNNTGILHREREREREPITGMNNILFPSYKLDYKHHINNKKAKNEKLKNLFLFKFVKQSFHKIGQSL